MIVLDQKQKMLSAESEWRNTNSPPLLLRSEKEFIDDYVVKISK